MPRGSKDDDQDEDLEDELEGEESCADASRDGGDGDSVAEFFEQFGPGDQDLIFQVARLAPETIHGVQAKGSLGETGRFEGLHTREQIETTIARVHGGGRYRLVVTRAGKYAGAKVLYVAGAPKLPPEMQPQPAPAPGGMPPQPPAPPPASDLASALRVALEPLLSRIAHAAPAAEPLLDRTVVNSLVQRALGSGDSKDDSEAGRLRKRLRELEEKVEDDKQEKVLAAAIAPVVERLDRLEERPRKKKRNPLEKIEVELERLAVFTAKMDHLRSRDEKHGDGLFSRLLKRAEKRLEPLIDKVVSEAESYLEEKARELEQTGRQPPVEDASETADADAEEDEGEDEAPESTNGTASAAPKETPVADDPKTFGPWVEALIKKPDLVADERHVREGLTRWPTLVRELSELRDKGRAVTFAGRVLGFLTARYIQRASDQDVARLLYVLEELRATIQQIDQAAAPPPAPAAAPTDGAPKPPTSPAGGAA